MNPVSDHPHALTAEGPGPVPTALVPHTHDDRTLLRRPSMGARLATRVQRDPGPALLVAACAGFAVGRLLRLAFRRMRAR